MRILILALSALLTSTTFAKEGTHIITGSTSSSLFFFDAGDKYESSFILGGGYDYACESGLMLGTNAGLSIGSGYSTYNLLVGPGFNFNKSDVANSAFASVKAGVEINRFYGLTSTDAVATLEVGKRFKLGDNVSYSPTISAHKMFSHNAADPTFALNLVKFSFQF
jgi:hypothetical protein